MVRRINRSFLQPLRAAMALSALVALGASACDRSSGDVREWTPADHDQPPGQGMQVPERPAGSKDGGTDNDLVELAWQRNCLNCHGPRGQGDGPQGPMVRAPDLTRPDWQERVTDEQITEVIRKGRNRMPAFDLPPQVVSGLVARIRAVRGSK